LVGRALSLIFVLFMDVYLEWQSSINIQTFRRAYSEYTFCLSESRHAMLIRTVCTRTWRALPVDPTQTVCISVVKPHLTCVPKFIWSVKVEEE
jgi:hypothetical protein